ncbi:MAG: hypothetical protein ACYDIC_02010 [Desulfobaccales bacterium]
MRQLVSGEPAELRLPLDRSLTKVYSRPAGDRGWSWRKADKFLLFILCNFLLLGLMFVHAAIRTETNLPCLQNEATIINYLGITDLCLSTEAAYTRHPSQHDWHAPFQSHPLALEYFPSGAIVAPPK